VGRFCGSLSVRFFVTWKGCGCELCDFTPQTSTLKIISLNHRPTQRPDPTRIFSSPIFSNPSWIGLSTTAACTSNERDH
jgi:hypothetical protein